MSAKKFSNFIHRSQTFTPFAPHRGKSGEFGLRQRFFMEFHDLYSGDPCFDRDEDIP
jgi:hypothetical protein